MARKLVYGVGVNDAPYVTEPGKRVAGRTVHAKKCPYFVLWKSMLKRCYGKSDPSYLGCIVDTSWHSFMAFKLWVQSQKQHDIWLKELNLPIKEREVKFQLDKDILGNGKLYSPVTCILVPSTLNSVLSHQKENIKELPLGVSWVSSRMKYRAYIMVENKYKSLGYYENPQLAHLAWQKEKCRNIFRLLTGYEKQPYKDVRVIQRFTEVVDGILEDISNLRETTNFGGGNI